MPKNKNTSPEAIFTELKKIAPSIAFSVRREEDSNYRWDGDGPDPAEEGYVAKLASSRDSILSEV